MEFTQEQKRAIEEIDRNLQIIACAGSGKTEVITRRVANILKNKPNIKPEQIVAFTFTEKAAESMKNRIDKVVSGLDEKITEKMYIGTIHAFCWKILCQYSEKYSQYKILDTVKSRLFVKRYHKECGMDDLELDVYPKNISLFLECIEKMVDTYEHREKWDELHREVFNKYVSCMESHGYISFSLLIFETLQQIRNNQNIREQLSDIRYLIVDEYQDVNDLQEQLIYLISECGANICVVGDDDQTIYQFRGSNAENIITFSERYNDVCKVRLETNFRCNSGIIEIADVVIQNNKRRINKKMKAARTTSIGEITATRYKKEEQYIEIGKKIKDLHQQGISYNEIAVLCKKGKHVRAISEVLYKMGIPVCADSAEQFFSGVYYSKFLNTIISLKDRNRAEIAQIWGDTVSSSVLKKATRRICGYTGQVYKMSNLIVDFCESISFLNEDCSDIHERKSAFDGIISILDDFDEIYGDWQISARLDGVADFLLYQAMQEYEYYNFNNEILIDSVQVMTIHKAKGLEFHSVFLSDLNNYDFPTGYHGGRKYWQVLKGYFEEYKNAYSTDLEDERKLFYVAVTRAKCNLFMTYELSKYRVSIFVEESANSSKLKINKEDLIYDPQKEKLEFQKTQKEMREKEREERKQEWEKEQRQRKEFFEIVKYAKAQLYDYYGTATHFCKGAYGDLERIEKMEPEQLIQEARRCGFL